MVAISVIVPSFNEGNNVSVIYNRLKASIQSISDDFEIIFINDGSRDNTLEEIKQLSRNDPRVKFISFSRNFGHQVAVSAGIDFSTGKSVVIIDGDLQDPPELIPELYKKYKEGFKVVYAKRRSRKGEGIMKKVTAKLFYRLLAKITSFYIPLDTGDFRLMDRLVVDQLKNMPEYNKFLRGQIAWIGFSQTFIEYDRDPRMHGETKYTMKKMLKFALDGITSFSNFPLKLASFIGFIVSGVAFLTIIWALYSRFVLHQTITGWTSLIISVLFLGGIQLLTIGVIGEYIGRINIDIKKRPLYIVEETNLEKA